MAADQKTADAFADSWNNLPLGSVYTEDQFIDWMEPLARTDFERKDVLELGCGNGSLMVHMGQWRPARLVGVDLGDSVKSAKQNLQKLAVPWEVRQDDLVSFRSEGFDVAYCIGVLHHLKDPRAGFDSLVRNTKPGGKFHAWVYAKEGNGVVRFVVDPIRLVVSRLPWWLTKWGVAFPLAVPFFCYAKLVALLPQSVGERLPLGAYSRWIAKREFAFFHHVAFDQLVTPQTAYLPRRTIEEWLAQTSGIEPESTYLLMRNGNSWKFGGRKAASNPGE